MKPNDPVVALVESFEAQTIQSGLIDAANIPGRRDLRANLLSAVTEAKRAQRLATLVDRLHGSAER